MKVWFIVLTLTTWDNGTPQTDHIGQYKTEEECLTQQFLLKDSYARNFPEGIVNVVDIHCETKEIKKKKK